MLGAKATSRQLQGIHHGKHHTKAMFCSLVLAIFSIACDVHVPKWSAFHRNLTEATATTPKLALNLDVASANQTSGKVALVTMVTESFSLCALNMLRSARAFGWKYPVYVLVADHHPLAPPTMQAIRSLGVEVLETTPYLDNWVTFNQPNGNFSYRGRLDVVKFRKLEILFNPKFRTYSRVIFMDADGLVASSLLPLVEFPFPENKTILLRQNDKSVGKRSLWENEIHLPSLHPPDQQAMHAMFPNRAKSGASSWFILNMRDLAEPEYLLRESKSLLCRFRSAFKYNDQALLNLLFYHELDIFPWCSWRELRVMPGSRSLRRYCKRNMKRQRRMNRQLTFMYRHLSVLEKKSCTTKAIGNDHQGILKQTKFSPLRSEETWQSLCWESESLKPP